MSYSINSVGTEVLITLVSIRHWFLKNICSLSNKPIHRLGMPFLE